MSLRSKLLTHPIVAAHLPNNPGDLATRVGAMADAIDSDKDHFSTTPPEVTVARQSVAALIAANRAVETKQPNAVQTRHVCVRTVKVDVTALGRLVQTVANTMSRDAAGRYIPSMLFEVSKVGQRPPKPELGIRQLAESGSVKLAALASPRPAAYHFEWSADGKAYTALPMRLVSWAVLSGLTPGQTYSFRVRVFVKGAMKDYSPVVTFIVK